MACVPAPEHTVRLAGLCSSLLDNSSLWKGSKEEVILDEKLVGGLLRQLCLLGYRASEDQLRQGKDDVHMQGLISELCAIKKEIDYEQGYPRCPSDESNSSSKAVRTVISRQHEITSPHVRLFADCPELQAAVDADCSLVNAEAMENQQRQFQAQQQHCEAEAASLHQQAASVQCVSPQHAAASVHDLLEAAEHSQSTIGQILQPWASEGIAEQQGADTRAGCLSTGLVNEVWQALEHVRCLSRSVTSLRDAHGCLQELQRGNVNASLETTDDKNQLDTMVKTVEQLSSLGLDPSNGQVATDAACVPDRFDFECILGEL
ncbi:hypothetical protein WJX74_001834 [Apatococcus lobatus]|uniref:Uncharacterized protein n=1 Tax=Apatococcus lobatus TaxID=904363 RepID=A0AAW1RBT3_9CHLO